jgi:GT2 family glycosyltransferase
MSTDAKLSVVVALIAGRVDCLELCLRALDAQTRQPDEILVPYDDVCRDVLRLQKDFPRVVFLHAAGLDTTAARAGAGREHHDTLRTIGLRAATGEFVALLEDHAYPSPEWCAAVTDEMRKHPRAAAIGGAVECESSSTLNWAVWFCDFGRYQSPMPEGLATFVSDSSALYRRSALEAIAEAWKNDYHETAVHGALVAAGYELRTTPRAVVWQKRPRLSWGTALNERYVWARSYAGTRARLEGSPRRWMLASLSPALPILMTGRIIQITNDRGRFRAELRRAVPSIVVLQTMWAIGEFVGYVTASPD